MRRKKGYSVLIIDDSENVRSIIRQAFADEKIFENIYEASDAVSGFKLVVHHHPDLIIVDLIMPQYDGFTFLKMKNAKPQFNDIPVIVLTSKDDASSKIKGLEEGAQDYVTKPFNAKELLARVKVHLKIKTLQDELKEKNAMLQKLSITDELTKIYNRRYVMQRLREELSRAQRYNETISLILIDLDNFKAINDKFGHQVGDSVLTKISALIKKQMRTSDVLGRYGGEEFLIILPNTSIEGSQSLAERIRKSLESNPVNVGRRRITATLSAGVVSYGGNYPSSYEDLIKKADKALYQAKKEGKNRVCIFK